MAPIQHINPLLFILDTLTESNTSAPNLDTPNLTSSNSLLGQQETSHVCDAGLYQTMLSDYESSEEYDIGDEDYVVMEDDVTPPKRVQSLVKRRWVQSNVYDYYEVSHEPQIIFKLAIIGHNTSNLNKHRGQCCGCFNAWSTKAPSTVDPNMGAKLAVEEQESILKQLSEGLVAIQVSFPIFELP
ncbi:hypothetical protein O181_060918 [Austropuccinia psidii MF-1]|uniref:Uncharacterized protein n=1 Tax=Austropuccinia psidii MF-1 TaxID=1389203 RepID=A0A9Q3ELS0_9BASI|nr:hypothetical protein [Austropuccinia psidii MF-1]